MPVVRQELSRARLWRRSRVDGFGRGRRGDRRRQGLLGHRRSRRWGRREDKGCDGGSAGRNLSGLRRGGVVACWEAPSARRIGLPAADSVNREATATQPHGESPCIRLALGRPSAGVSSTYFTFESAAPRARASWASRVATTGTDRPASSGPAKASRSEREPIRYRLSGCEPFRPKAALSQSIRPALPRHSVVVGLDRAVTGVDDRKRDRLAVENAYGGGLFAVGTPDTLRPRLSGLRLRNRYNFAKARLRQRLPKRRSLRAVVIARRQADTINGVAGCGCDGTRAARCSGRVRDAPPSTSNASWSSGSPATSRPSTRTHPILVDVFDSPNTVRTVGPNPRRTTSPLRTKRLQSGA